MFTVKCSLPSSASALKVFRSPEVTCWWPGALLTVHCVRVIVRCFFSASLRFLSNPSLQRRVSSFLSCVWESYVACFQNTVFSRRHVFCFIVTFYPCLLRSKIVTRRLWRRTSEIILPQSLHRSSCGKGFIYGLERAQRWDPLHRRMAKALIFALFQLALLSPPFLVQGTSTIERHVKVGFWDHHIEIKPHLGRFQDAWKVSLNLTIFSWEPLKICACTTLWGDKQSNMSPKKAGTCPVFFMHPQKMQETRWAWVVFFPKEGLGEWDK